jgi:phage-related protein
MRESLEFFFNNQSSSNFGIVNINLEGGLITERLFASRELLEEQLRGKTKPYFLSVEQKPFEFQMAFAFLNSFDNTKMREISRWLNVSYYKEFYFMDNPQFRFFVMPVVDSMITHNGMNQGYVTLTMRSNDAYSYSQEILTENYDLSLSPPEGTLITIDNDGDIPIGLEMWITKYNDGEITIINTNDNNKEFTINNIKDYEQVYINHENEDIQSNVPNKYHFDDVTTDFMKLPIGRNVLNIIGRCKIQFRYRFKYLVTI